MLSFSIKDRGIMMMTIYWNDAVTLGENLYLEVTKVGGK